MLIARAILSRWALLLFVVILVTGPMAPLMDKTVTKNNLNDASANNRLSCDNTTGLEKCVGNIRKRLDDGTSTNLKAIQNTCKFIRSQVLCMIRWSPQCIKTLVEKQLTGFTTRGLKFYQELCNDSVLRMYLSTEGNCLIKTFVHWIECTKHFDVILRLRKTNPIKNDRSICCVHLRFLKCIKIVGERYCAKNEITYFEKLALILIRTDETTTYNPNFCKGVDMKICKGRSDFASSVQKFEGKNCNLYFLIFSVLVIFFIIM